MEKVQNSAKYRSLRWHYPDQVRSKFNTSSQTVHRLPYLIWTYSNANTRKSQGNCLQKTMKKEWLYNIYSGEIPYGYYGAYFVVEKSPIRPIIKSY